MFGWISSNHILNIYLYKGGWLERAVRLVGCEEKERETSIILIPRSICRVNNAERAALLAAATKISLSGLFHSSLILAKIASAE